jgi:hypothetical protein
MVPESRDDRELLALLKRAVDYLETEDTNGRVERSEPARERSDEIRGRLRRLLTVRPPGPLPTHVHEWLDTLLQPVSSGFRNPKLQRSLCARLRSG